MKRNTLIGNVKNSGLGIIGVESRLTALKAAWLLRILKSKRVQHSTLHVFCNRYDIDVMYALQFSSNVNYLKCPSFLREVLCALNECKNSCLDVMSIYYGSPCGTLGICVKRAMFYYFLIRLRVVFICKRSTYIITLTLRLQRVLLLLSKNQIGYVKTRLLFLCSKL